ncbi:hypothetical protein COCON_G00085810 [Conger conger]|uniref:Uncharacterized protein n=1 Tax=Conger conger TaxID=82655 RepID=A0A9Q1DKC8_CONCO|nr:hypothetical protein COCON_G00085810 [Conger conger]
MCNALSQGVAVAIPSSQSNVDHLWKVGFLENQLFGLGTSGCVEVDRILQRAETQTSWIHQRLPEARHDLHPSATNPLSEMDEVDALRIKSLSNDILSPPSDTESAPQEGDSSALEAELWSRAVGAQKEAIKRQDVIYEWLQLKDAQVAQAVSERMLVLGELSGLEPPPLLPQGEPLLQAAVADVETLQAFLLGGLREEVWKNVCDEEGGATEGVAMDKSLTSDPQLTGLSGTDVLEQPVEENTLSSWDQSDSFPVAQFFDRVLKLSQRLYTLQVVVLQQESHVELQRAAERQRNLERRREELAGFQRERGGFREEQERWEQERGGRERELQAREEALQSREEERLQREARLREAQAQLEEHRQQYQQDLERLRDATRATERERERLERLTTLRNKSSPALLSSQPSQTSVRSPPPPVPPRRESMLRPPRTNQHKLGGVQQHIPTRLAQSKSKERRDESRHQRSNSSVSLDLRQIFPIKISGKDNGSWRGKRSVSPHQLSDSAASLDLSEIFPIKMPGERTAV